MKQKFQYFKEFLLPLLLLLLVSSHLTTARAARVLTEKQGRGELMAADGLSQVARLGSEVEEENPFSVLEDCEKGDKECWKRRMIAEAHVDYIYTQHHKP
ncbi:hypothetical protein ACLOJK_020756 [Asimina triloba]